jgi:hypothetical protein
MSGMAGQRWRTTSASAPAAEHGRSHREGRKADRKPVGRREDDRPGGYDGDMLVNRFQSIVEAGGERLAFSLTSMTSRPT